MSYQFKKHYTREEARALLPKVREWLQKIRFYRDRLAHAEVKISSLLQNGDELGGELVNETLRQIAEFKELLVDLRKRAIFVKDFDRGLVDFAALRNGREVFLCWEEDEDDIEFWHDIESGYEGREKLDH